MNSRWCVALVVVLAVAPSAMSPRAAAQQRDAAATGYRAAATSSSPPPVWGPATQVSGFAASEPALTFAADGTATVAYSSPTGIRVRQQAPGEAWQPAQRVGSGFGPALGVDAQGTVTMVWLHPIGHLVQVVKASRHREGGGWSRPVRIAKAHDVLRLHLAVSASGAVVLGWLEPSTDEFPRDLVRAVYRPPHGQWTKPITLRGAALGDPAVTIGRFGAARVFYGDRQHHLAVRMHGLRRWRDPRVLPTGVREVSADSGSPGVTVVAWQSRRSVLKTAQFTRRWGVARRATGLPAQTWGLRIAAAQDDSAVVAWMAGAFGEPGAVDGVSLAPDGVAGDRQQIFGTGAACLPATLVGNDRGDALLAWSTDLRDGSTPLLATYRSSGTGQWPPATDLTQGRSTAVCYPPPDAAIAPDGSAIAAWMEYDADHPDQYGDPGTKIITRRTATGP